MRHECVCLVVQRAFDSWCTVYGISRLQAARTRIITVNLKYPGSELP